MVYLTKYVTTIPSILFPMIITLHAIQSKLLSEKFIFKHYGSEESFTHIQIYTPPRICKLCFWFLIAEVKFDVRAVYERLQVAGDIVTLEQVLLHIFWCSNVCYHSSGAPYSFRYHLGLMQYHYIISDTQLLITSVRKSKEIFNNEELKYMEFYYCKVHQCHQHKNIFEVYLDLPLIKHKKKITLL